MGKAGLADLARLRVLVVGDNPTFHRVFKGILRALGVQHVYEALNATVALREMYDARPDVVFVDWRMEPVDGLNFVRAIRNAERSPDPLVPIIMLTGHAEAQRVKAARDAGVTEFLVKPVSIQSVVTRLDEILYRPRAFIRAPVYVGPDRRRRARDHRGLERRGRHFEAHRVIDV